MDSLDIRATKERNWFEIIVSFSNGERRIFSVPRQMLIEVRAHIDFLLKERDGEPRAI